MPSKKNQQNYWYFYPSEPLQNGHFNVRHPVFSIPTILRLKKILLGKKDLKLKKEKIEKT